MRPGEVLTVATQVDPENAPFNAVVHGQGISVWVNVGLDAEVFDAQGGLVPSGHIGGRTACSRAQPDDRRSNCGGAEVDVAALVVAGGDRAELLELVDRPFDGVALLVALGVEARWPTSARTFAPAGGLGVGLLRDSVCDAASPQVPANKAIAVRLVRSHAAGLAARPTDEARHPDLVQYRLELRAVRSLALSDEQRERSAASVRTQVDLGGEPAA
jgi:hypothetical protein